MLNIVYINGICSNRHSWHNADGTASSALQNLFISMHACVAEETAKYIYHILTACYAAELLISVMLDNLTILPCNENHSHTFSLLVFEHVATKLDWLYNCFGNYCQVFTLIHARNLIMGLKYRIFSYYTTVEDAAADDK